MNKPTHVSYAANQHGYTVRVLSGSETLEEYNGGNNPLESTSWTDPALGGSVPAETLREYAKQTALEMAADNGVPVSAVGEDTDLLDGDAE